MRARGRCSSPTGTGPCTGPRTERTARRPAPSAVPESVREVGAPTGKWIPRQELAQGRGGRTGQEEAAAQSAHLPRMAKCLGSMVKPRFDLADLARPRNISGGASIMVPQSAHMKWAWAWLASR